MMVIGGARRLGLAAARVCPTVGEEAPISGARVDVEESARGAGPSR